MYTLTHISDLHRSGTDRMSNDELLSCLLADRRRFPRETPPISHADAIVVSGDLVQGLPLGSTDYPEALKEQYDEAFDLLTRLADAFVEGDHSKVIIIPGNHDVDWNEANSTMVPTEPNKQKIRELLSNSNSSYRWSWESLQLLEIADHDRYRDRFKYFCDLYERFYHSTRVAFPLDPKRAWNLFALDEDRILACAFNSCANSDCFSFFSEISAQAIAQSHLAAGDDYFLKVAVWHHDVQGPSRRSDYIDPDIVQLMIDRGYRLGMHGHQHKSDALPYYLHTFQKDTMAVLSAGSLCADPYELPPGFNRQYNVVEISDNYRQARLHVREMKVRGVFAPGSPLAFDRRSYADIDWTSAPLSPRVNTGRGGGLGIARFEGIEKLIEEKSYEDARKAIYESGLQYSKYGRRLLSEALFRGKMWEELEEHLSTPDNADELTKLVMATIALKHWTKGEQALSVAEESGQFPAMTIRDLRNRLNAKKGISP